MSPWTCSPTATCACDRLDKSALEAVRQEGEDATHFDFDKLADLLRLKLLLLLADEAAAAALTFAADVVARLTTLSIRLHANVKVSANSSGPAELVSRVDDSRGAPGQLQMAVALGEPGLVHGLGGSELGRGEREPGEGGGGGAESHEARRGCCVSWCGGELVSCRVLEVCVGRGSAEG